MPEIVDTFSDLEAKDSGWYEAKDSQGRVYSTKDRGIAKQLYDLIESGGTGHIEFTEKQGGQFNQFTNRYINSLSAVQDGGAYPQAGGGLALPDEPIRTISGPDPFADTEPEIPVARNRDAEKELAINKAVALKAAVDTIQYFEPDQRTSTNITGVAEYFLAWLQDYRP